VTAKALRPCARATTVALAALALTALPAAALAAASFAGGFSAAPVNTGTADYVSLSLEASRQATATVRVTNLRAGRQTLWLYAVRGVTSRISGDAYVGAGRACQGVGCWIHSLPSRISVRAGTSVDVTFAVRVPPGTAPGQYLAGVAIEPPVSPRSPQPVNSGSAATSVILRQIVIGVAVTVGRRFGSDVTIPTVRGVAIGNTAGIAVAEHNRGARFEHPAGRATIVVDGTPRSFAVRSGTVLPGGDPTLRVLTPSLRAGTYPARATLRYDDDRKTAAWTGTVTIPAIRVPTFVPGKGGTLIEEPPPSPSPSPLLLLALGAGVAILGIAAGALARRLWKQRLQRTAA